jgi:hypothetical protein
MSDLKQKWLSARGIATILAFLAAAAFVTYLLVDLFD